MKIKIEKGEKFIELNLQCEVRFKDTMMVITSSDPKGIALIHNEMEGAIEYLGGGVEYYQCTDSVLIICPFEHFSFTIK